MSDITSQNLVQEVVGISCQIPILVDSWTPWYGPCRTPGPMLEKLEAEYVGKWKFTKINSGEDPELSAQFHVRSIPCVVVFVDGKPVGQFVGVLPEAQLRTFLDRVTSQSVEVAYREGLATSQIGETALTRGAFQNALVFDPGSDAARFALVNLLLDTGGTHTAQGEFALLLPKIPQDARYVPLETRLRATERAGMLPGADALHAVVQAQPDSLQTRLDLAQQYIADQDYGAALEQLLAIAEQDCAFRDDIARKTMVSVLDIIRDVPQAVLHWCRQFASKLN